MAAYTFNWRDIDDNTGKARGWPPGRTGEYYDGTTYIRGRTNAAIGEGDIVTVERDSGLVNGLTKTRADNLRGATLAMSLQAVASGKLAFFAVKNFTFAKANIANGTTVDRALYTTSTTGRLSSTSTSQTRIGGIHITTAPASSNNYAPCTVGAEGLYVDNG